MSGNKFSKIIKIALISILAIIVVSVIIAITNNSHSPIEPSSNSKTNIETNNSIAIIKKKNTTISLIQMILHLNLQSKKH